MFYTIYYCLSLNLGLPLGIIWQYYGYYASLLYFICKYFGILEMVCDLNKSRKNSGVHATLKVCVGVIYGVGLNTWFNSVWALKTKKLFLWLFHGCSTTLTLITKTFTFVTLKFILYKHINTVYNSHPSTEYISIKATANLLCEPFVKWPFITFTQEISLTLHNNQIN